MVTRTLLSFLSTYIITLLVLPLSCQGKTLGELLDVGDSVTRNSLARLGKWLETAPPLDCERSWPRKVRPKRRVGAIVGPMNTGTNFMAAQLRFNCPEAHAWQGWYDALEKPVNGKHARMVALDPEDRVLICGMNPLVMVRDPLTWMRSTCLKTYGEIILPSGGCPRPKKEGQKIKDRETHKEVDDLLQWWNYFYSPYLEPDQFDRNPFAFIRYEDVLLYPKRMTALICTTLGTPLKAEDVIVANSSHSPGQTGKPIIDQPEIARKAALPTNLLSQYSVDDLRYFGQVVDHNLTRAFGYPWVEIMNLRLDD